MFIGVFFKAHVLEKNEIFIIFICFKFEPIQ